MRQPFPQPDQQFVGELIAGIGVVDKLDRTFDRLAHIVVGNAEHRRVHHLWMRDQQALGLLRVDVDSARDDHVVAAVGQVEEALVIEVADITDGRPAPLVAGGGGLLGVVEVLEGVAALEIDLPGLTGGEFIAVLVEDVHGSAHRPADRPGMHQPLLGADQG